MEDIRLTTNAESVLQEIMDNRLPNGSCNDDYWAKRFEGLEYAEDTQLRSIFKELSDAEMITCNWYDDVPCYLTVLNNGSSYFEMKKAAELQEKKEKRSNRRHDLLMVLIGAAIGAVLAGVVEFILFKCFGIGG